MKNVALSRKALCITLIMEHSYSAQTTKLEGFVVCGLFILLHRAKLSSYIWLGFLGVQEKVWHFARVAEQLLVELERLEEQKR